jgi:hypothetical protein
MLDQQIPAALAADHLERHAILELHLAPFPSARVPMQLRRNDESNKT